MADDLTCSMLAMLLLKISCHSDISNHSQHDAISTTMTICSLMQWEYRLLLLLLLATGWSATSLGAPSPPVALCTCQVWRRTPGEPGTLIYTEHDPKHFVALTRTKDWSYLLINSHSKLSSEVRTFSSCQRTSSLEYASSLVTCARTSHAGTDDCATSQCALDDILSLTRLVTHQRARYESLMLAVVP